MEFAGKKLLFLVNELDFFLSHRLPLALAAQDAGFEVHVAGPSSAAARRIEECGFRLHHVPMTRSGIHPVRELRALAAIYRLLRRLRPDLVHNVALKAVLYGSLAARLAGGTAVVNALTGLGFVFISQGLKARSLRWCIMLGLRFAFKLPGHRLLMQNRDDPELFLAAGVVAPDRIAVIRGSGVDMGEFHPAPEPVGAVRAVLVSRMLWDKGVGEFAHAAHQLKERGLPVSCELVGDGDAGNPACVPVSQLQAWDQGGALRWLGHSSRVAEVFAGAHIVCLPSYREGLPKVLIEAAACGRPIVASDVPGCREIVRHGENGLLVPVRDGAALADALQCLVQDADLRRQMGARGRELAVREFSVQQVLRETLDLYRNLLLSP